VLWGLAFLYAARGALYKARKLGERLVDLAKNTEEPTQLLAAHTALGFALMGTGEFEAAADHLDEVIRLHDPNKHRWLASVYLIDPGIMSRVYKGDVLRVLGFPDQALEMIWEGRRLAEELSHPFTSATVMLFAASSFWYRGDYKEAKEMADSFAAYSDEHGFAQYSLLAALMQGMALLGLGQLEEGILQVHAAKDALVAAGLRLIVPIWIALLGQAYGMLGENERGLAVVSEAMELARETGQRAADSFIFRIKGELLMGCSPEDALEAERCLQEAIDVARDSKARYIELVAATSLARLWQKQSKRGEAREMLTDIYGWFTEGFDTQPLKHAKALLDELD